MSKLCIQYEQISKELSHGLCAFFNNKKEPTLSIKNEGIEIYEQSPFDFENIKDKMLPKRKNKSGNENNESNEKMKKSKSAQKIVNRQGVSIILQGKFASDAKAVALMPNNCNAIPAKVLTGKSTIP